MGDLFKDQVLAELAHRANVAQFVSFGPRPAGEVRFVCIRGFERDHQSNRSLIAMLLAQSPVHSVNVRSFNPASPQNNEFIYGLTREDDVLDAIGRLGAANLFTIVNETVDVNDGGVSGVAHGSSIEFAPDDTPRCVEKPGTLGLPRTLGISVLAAVYGFRPEVDYPESTRIEFSLHPQRRGIASGHTIIWELQDALPPATPPTPRWPNHFSRLIGDKAFGLLLAAEVGLRVPKTVVVSRRIAPFSFGKTTRTGEWWMRTAPAEPAPGKHETTRGWTDPFGLLAAEPSLASVMAQESVDSRFSGGVLRTTAQGILVEGVSGFGDAFMLGQAPPEKLPPNIVRSVRSAFGHAHRLVGASRGEWAHDGTSTWILQLHVDQSATQRNVVVAGQPERFVDFDANAGLEALRELVANLGSGLGIRVIGQVGVTSHFGDVLRRSSVPSVIQSV
jgi:hypothetical protein